jgi:hypothetical protein
MSSQPLLGAQNLRSPRRHAKLTGPIVDSIWLAERTGWSVSTICRLARERKIPGAFRACRGKGSRWRFRRVPVEEWFAGDDLKR